LWLNDDKALEGLSKLPLPKPKKPAQHKPLMQAVRPAKHAGASRASEVFHRTNEKRTTTMVARIDCLMFLPD
jgi:hypothetical protein